MSGMEIFGCTAFGLGIIFAVVMAFFVIKRSDKDLEEAKRRFLESRRIR